MSSQLLTSVILVVAGALVGFACGCVFIRRPVFHRGSPAGGFVGRYNTWANGLTTTDFSSLVWTVGEFSSRARLVFAVLDGDLELSSARKMYPFQRARLALEAIATLGRGEEFDLSRFMEATRQLKAKLQE